MEFYEAVDRRRTVRAFTKAASDEKVRKIILTGTKSMSGGNSQPWEFVIVDDARTIDQIAEQKYQMNRNMTPAPGRTQADVEKGALEQKRAYQNCSVVAVCHKAGHGGALSAWMCIQNMALAAAAEGLGVVPSTFSGEYKKAVQNLLAIPDDYELGTVMLIGVQAGYPDLPRISRRPEFSWLHRNRFGSKV